MFFFSVCVCVFPHHQSLRGGGRGQIPLPPYQVRQHYTLGKREGKGNVKEGKEREEETKREKGRRKGKGRSNRKGKTCNHCCNAYGLTKTNPNRRKQAALKIHVI